MTAVLYASVAEKYGRRAVLILYITGSLLLLMWMVVVCQFPPKVDRMRAKDHEALPLISCLWNSFGYLPCSCSLVAVRESFVL